jgi:hypothetical protein
MAWCRIALLAAAQVWIPFTAGAQETQRQSEDDRIVVMVDSAWRTNEYPSEYRPRTFRVPSLGEEADFVVIHFTIVRVKNGHVTFPGPGGPSGPGPTVVDTDDNEYTPIQMWRRHPPDAESLGARSPQVELCMV